MSDIGGNIRYLRKLHKLNQVEFSHRINVSQGSLSDIESGKSKPSIETVISIHQSFDCSFEWLLTGKEKIINNELSEFENSIIHIVRCLEQRDKIELMEIARIKYNKKMKKNDNQT